MRTAVVRVNVDPAGLLSVPQLRHGITALRKLAVDVGAELVDSDLAGMPVDRREVQLLIGGEDADAMKTSVVGMCVKAFGTTAVAGVLTYVSRGTDDDAQGVLAGFGLTGEIRRLGCDDGYDVVYVTLRESDLDRIPESRIRTALEASLNCEVRIETR